MSVVVNGFDVTLETMNSASVRECTFTIRNIAQGYSFQLYVAKYPTNNCQLSAIGSMNFLLEHANSVKANVQAVIRECYRQIGMYLDHLILVDVKDRWVASVEQCFTVVKKTPYVSTNNSSMCIFLVKL